MDTSDAVVRQLRRKLEEQGKPVSKGRCGNIKLISSKDAKTLHQMAQELMQSNLDNHSIESQLVSAFK
jgi:glutamate racemase